jgi:hypothetical protein
MITLIGICLGIGLVFNFWQTEASSRGHKMAFPIYIGIIVVLCICVIAIPIVVQYNQTMDNAFQIAAYEDATLCYDKTTNEYFALKMNMWNVNVYQRHELNQEYAKKLAEASELRYVKLLEE